MICIVLRYYTIRRGKSQAADRFLAKSGGSRRGGGVGRDFGKIREIRKVFEKVVEKVVEKNRRALYKRLKIWYNTNERKRFLRLREKGYGAVRWRNKRKFLNGKWKYGKIRYQKDAYGRV